MLAVEPPVMQPIELGQLIFFLCNDTAPIAAENFWLLTKGVDRFRYKNMIFNCIIPSFIIQGGDVDHKFGFGRRSVCGNMLHGACVL